MIARTIEWKDNKVLMIDQRELPAKYEMLTCSTYYEVIDAIKNMAIRGAPAIGVAAAYGMALAAHSINTKNKSDFLNRLKKAKIALSSSRPTAINLFWALEEIWKGVVSSDEPVDELKKKILLKAESLAQDDIKTNYLIGEYGSTLFQDGDRILTHCNAGSLATVFYGTALGVIRSAFKEKKNIKIYIDETRPVLQGARLTAWELQIEEIPVTLICDSVAGFLMYQKKIDKVILGADRIAANGDIANKIGTYSISVLAKTHNIPFYVAAPTSTIDFNIEDGKGIPIEEREPLEVTSIMGKKIAPDHINVYNPAFDITPNENITAIITEYGIAEPPYIKTLNTLLTKNKR
ncbi:MAG: S-methyl-5-thioribose-1-phosphate isomerase [Atribacterota bacterium]|jgi:methylthioribose-1-phosphate isomerase|nr:S-methyl-5-thioribose-1-phosphate isomerase [Atribacterota bacterium]MDY0382120.1 S-methyl-5-thioribose-1-phosphate isomerase [Atribacterota bacterium]